MSSENKTHANEQQLRYYRGMIERIRKGTVVPAYKRLGLDRNNICNLSGTEKLIIWMKYINPERLACEQVIIEDFFNSPEFLELKSQIIKSSISAQDLIIHSKIPFTDEFYRTVDQFCFRGLRRYIYEIDSNPEISPAKTALNMLVENQEIFGTTYSPSNKNYEQSLLSGIGTATEFCKSLEPVIKNKLGDTYTLSSADKINIVNAVRSTFQAQGAFFGSFSLKYHSISLKALYKDDPRIFFRDSGFYPDNFEGDLRQGKPLRPKKEILDALKVKMKNASQHSTAKFECPALITQGGKSAMQKFMLLFANSLLHRIGILSKEELINSSL